MEIKDILTEFDIPIPQEGIEKLTIDDIRKIRDEKFIGRAVADQDQELVSKITGKRLGSLETEIKRGLKNIGVELTADEIKDKKVEEIYSIGLEKVQKSIEDLKKKSSEGNDKKLNDLQVQFESLNKSLKEKEELLTNANSLIEQKEKEFGDKLKTFKIGHKLNEAKAKVQFAETVNDLTKKGFEFEFGQKYKVDIDEQENLVITDKEGNKLKNSTGTGYLSFEEVYTSEAGQHKLLKANGVEPQKTVSTGTQVITPQNGNNSWQVNPRAANVKYAGA